MRIKRFMIVLLSVMIVLTSGLLGACQSDTNVPSSSPSSSSSQSPQASPSPSSQTVEETVDPFGKYDTPITLTSVFASASAVTDMLSGLGTGETLDDNRWTKLMKDELNIDVQYTAEVDMSQFNEKINIMIASGQVPDYLTGLSATTVKQMVDGGLVIPVRDLSDKWSSDVNKTFNNINKYLNWSAFNFDNDYYAIPTVGDSDPLDNTSIIWIRRDWLKNLNLQEPKTLEDLDNVIKAFATQDPDQDGASDTVGLGVMGGDQFLSSIMGYFNSNNAYPDIWLKDQNGKLAKGLVMPEVKNTLAKLQDIYAKGYIDTEFSIKGVPQMTEDIANGKVGMFFGIHASPLVYGFAAEKAVDPKADWVALPLPGKASISAPAAVITGTVISKNCKNPEAVIKMMNVANKFDVSADAETKNFYVNDAHNFVVPVKYPHLPMTNLYMCLNTTKMLNGMDVATARDSAIDEFYPPEDAAIIKKMFENETENIIYTLVNPYVQNQTADNYPWYIIFGPEGSENVLRTYWDNYNSALQQDMYLGPITENMSEYAPTEQKMRDETFTRIIMGQDDISAFDDFVKNISAVGYSDVEQEVNDWYQQNK